MMILMWMEQTDSILSIIALSFLPLNFDDDGNFFHLFNRSENFTTLRSMFMEKLFSPTSQLRRLSGVCTLFRSSCIILFPFEKAKVQVLPLITLAYTVPIKKCVFHNL